MLPQQGVMPMAQQVQQAQMRAVQQSMPQGMQGMYAGYGMQQQMPYGGFGGFSQASAVPGYGMPMDAYGMAQQQQAFAQQQAAQGMGQPQMSQGQSKGKGSGKGKGKGKGKGFSKGSGFSSEPRESWNLSGETDPKRQIEIAQRRAKQRDREAIIQAQQSALRRFEKDHLDRLQGKWYDGGDPNTTYIVEGNMVSVESSDNERVFKNRLAIFNGDICWDAKRFWHKLNVDKDLPPVGEDVEKVSWTLGEGSGPTKPVVWQRTQPDPPPEPVAPAEETKDAAADATKEAAAEEKKEAAGEEAKEAPAADPPS